MMHDALHTLRLEGSQTIRDAAALAGSLSEALAAHDGLRVETAAVASVDVGILQVLVAAHKTARRMAKPLSIEAGPGGALEAALEASGIAARAIRLETGSWTGLCTKDEELSR